ncbi:hypothetical protein PRIC1_001121 [Phytophthora ramorum]|uniref:Uncharacterized protein n=1 Tax=Phytophthora ramorum TaxID=164328 RepID=H3GFP4_PHYRM|nr:hypothetical protein KRP23_7779 [Phytophthora ramorum]KAH7508719.1 hypothetical protein KRP22_232 [Phytophthora ramorum]
MDIVWGRFQAAYPRKTCTVMDDDAGKLRQPLMASGGEDDSGDEEMGGLVPMRPLVDEGAAARRKRRRRKEDEDLGEVARGVAVSVEPLQLLRSVGKWMASHSAAGNLLTPHSPKRSHRRRMENMDEVSDRALALLALITIGFCLVLLLVVYAQAP